MPSTNKTASAKLSQFTGSDKPAWLQDYNEDMLKIDNVIAAKAPVESPSFTGTSTIPQIAGLTSINGVRAQRTTIFSGNMAPATVDTVVPGNYNLQDYDELIFMAAYKDVYGWEGLASTIVPIPMASWGVSVVTGSRSSIDFMGLLSVVAYNNCNITVTQAPHSCGNITLREVIGIKYIL